MSKFPAATYARTLSVVERDLFANFALRSRDPRRAIAVFERQRRRPR